MAGMQALGMLPPSGDALLSLNINITRALNQCLFVTWDLHPVMTVGRTVVEGEQIGDSRLFRRGCGEGHATASIRGVRPGRASGSRGRALCPSPYP